jgi:G3E family GTPase
MAIPITVFTGFLGAGKTSIIMSLLPQLPKEYRVVLLKNEFGEVEGCLILIALLGSQLTILRDTRPKSIVN